MSHCCGTKKKFKQEKVKRQEVKGRAGKEPFWEKLLTSLGLKTKDKALTGGS